jgi:hypothetical protein
MSRAKAPRPPRRHGRNAFSLGDLGAWARNVIRFIFMIYDNFAGECLLEKQDPTALQSRIPPTQAGLGVNS